MQTLKAMLPKAYGILLKYLEQDFLITVQADASKKDLGTCIMLTSKTIAFGSKSLTDSETWYGNIE